MTSSAGDYSHERLSRHEVMRVATAAVVDTRCVVRYLRMVHDGEEDMKLRETTITRVERALAKCGHHALID